MASSTAPDLGSTARIGWTAAAVTAVVCTLLLAMLGGRVDVTLGDTDDAMRLVMVRELLAGGGWSDLHVDRLQPPHGVDMHWSRLVDAGLAGLWRLMGLGLGPEGAERATRAIWPLLWIAPAVAATLALARRLGGSCAVFPAAVILALSLPLYVQFAPGRIDHHNIQIAMALVGLAGVAWSGARGGAAAGLAAALGLAVGLEALLFHALVGASFALRWAADGGEARGARAYAVMLGAGLPALYAMQTPPGQWSGAACDVLSANLLAAAAVGAGGLLIATLLARRAPASVRLAAVAATGAVAAALYVGMNPTCIGGPLAQTDSRLGPIWLDHVSEVAPIWRGLTVGANPDFALLYLVVLGGLGLAWGLSSPEARRDPAWLTVAAFLLLAIAAHVFARRMESYSAWCAAAVLGAALARGGARWWENRLLPTVFAAWGASAFVPLAAGALLEAAQPAAAVSAASDEACSATASYAALARLEPGVVAGEIDLGPYVLAHTPHAVLSAPYHRMDEGILAAHGLLAGAPAAGAAPARALGVRYVVTCPARKDLPGLGRGTLKPALDEGRPPAWLERVSAPGAALAVYRVKAAAALRGLRGPADPASAIPPPRS